MRYIGSKASTVECVYRLISEKVFPGTICDPFGGIGTVGSYFKARGYSVWSGDILTFAYYFQVARVESNTPPSFDTLRAGLGLKSPTDVVHWLNNESPMHGWFVREYSEKRQFFTMRNAAHIEACRLRLSQWAGNGWLSRSEHAVLLASLINSMDRVANTAGTYYAYLKTWDRKALSRFRFELIPPRKGNPNCCCFLTDARQLVARRGFDVLYLDPPYNERRYERYYHLPETIALEENPDIHGKCGMPNTARPTSDFNRRRRARSALQELLKSAQFRLLAFHYGDSGLIAPEEVRRILGAYGRVEEFLLNSTGYTTSRTARTVQHRLYLVNHG